MKLWLARILVFGASLSLMACATTSPPFNHLDAGARPHIKTVDSILIAPQDRIGADISKDNTIAQLSALIPGSAMIPALVDLGVTSVRVMSANKHAKPMRESLENHDYAWEFRKQVRHSLRTSRLEGVDSFAIIRQEYPGMRGQIIDQSDADAVLIVDMRYAFTKEFDGLYVSSYAMLFPNKEELGEFKERPDRDDVIEFTDNIYRNKFAAVVPVGVKDGTKAENAAYWAELSEEELTDLLEVAGLKLADAMANDINIDDIYGEIIYDDFPPKIEVEQEDIDGISGIKAEGVSDPSSDAVPETPQDRVTEDIVVDDVVAEDVEIDAELDAVSTEAGTDS